MRWAQRLLACDCKQLPAPAASLAGKFSGANVRPMSIPSSKSTYSRRALIRSGSAFVGLMLLGCSGESSGKAAAKLRPATPKLTMYKDPSCGCCGKWADAARKAGFQVAEVETSDMSVIKARLGVPDELISCHTTVAGPYVIEGHVPLDAVKRLLARRPKIRGIAVPGMPIGSPGMEVPGRPAQKFDVMAFDAAGKVSIFKA